MSKETEKVTVIGVIKFLLVIFLLLLVPVLWLITDMNFLELGGTLFIEVWGGMLVGFAIQNDSTVDYISQCYNRGCKYYIINNSGGDFYGTGRKKGEHSCSLFSNVWDCKKHRTM